MINHQGFLAILKYAAQKWPTMNSKINGKLYCISAFYNCGSTLCKFQYFYHFFGIKDVIKDKKLSLTDFVFYVIGSQRSCCLNGKAPDFVSGVCTQYYSVSVPVCDQHMIIKTVK